MWQAVDLTKVPNVAISEADLSAAIHSRGPQAQKEPEKCMLVKVHWDRRKCIEPAFLKSSSMRCSCFRNLVNAGNLVTYIFFNPSEL